MADKETRQARKQAHALIDPLWQSGKYKRGTVYARLSDAFGEQVHVGQASKEYCQDIMKTVKLLFPESAGIEKGEQE